MFDIKIPCWCKRVKIDVGTSCNAPHSENWINNNNDCCVFAFEPNPYNIESIQNEEGKMWPVWLKKDKIGKSFFIYNYALSWYNQEEQDFYCTDGDSGTSSLFKPLVAPVKEIVKVKVIRLSDFFEEFPWNKINYIEQLKIDAQSSDFNILLGAGKYIEKVAYIDIETHTNGQYDNEENPGDIKQYLEDNGFSCSNFGINACFFNERFRNRINEMNYCFLHE